MAVGGQCRRDTQCPAGTICEKGRCAKIKRALNILWLFYRSADRRYTSVMGLYHHKKGGRGFRVMAPFYFHFWSPQESSRVVPPFYWDFRNRRRGTRHTLFLNFHYHRGRGFKGFNVWPLLFTRSYGKRGFSFTLAPLVHYARRGKAWSMYLLLFPPWYVSRRPGKTTWAVLPLAAGSHRRTKALVWTLPLNFYWRRGNRRHLLLFPLFYHGTRGTSRTTSLLLPLYFYHRRGTQGTLFVSPLAMYFRDRRAGKRWFWWTAPPILVSRSRQRSFDMVLPFYLREHDRRRGTSYVVVPPLLFGHSRDLGRRTSFTLAGHVFVRRGPDRWCVGVMPLLYFGRDRHRNHQVLFPLFWRRVDRRRGRSVVQLLTAFWWRRRDSHGHGFLPFYWFERTYDHRGYVSSSLTVLPLFHHRNDRAERLLVTPLGGYYEDYRLKRKTAVILTGFWRRTRTATTWGVLPLFVSRHAYRRPSHFLWFFPTGWTYRNRRTRAGGLFPLVWYIATPRRKSFVVFPLYWHLHKKRGWRSDVLLPLFALVRKKRHRFLFAFPFYSWERPAGREYGVLPLLFLGFGRHVTYGHFFPLVWHYRNRLSGRSVTVALPYYRSTRPQASHSGLLPLAFWGRQGASRYGVGFPLVWYFADAETKARTVVVGPVYHHRWKHSRGLVYENGLFPLLRVRTGALGTVVTAPPLVHYSANEHHRRLWTPLFGFGHDQRTKNRYGYVGPVYWQRSPRRNTQVVFPLLWRYASSVSQHRTLVLAPLYIGHRTPDRRTDIVLPLFVHRRVRQARDVVLFPLLWVFHRPTKRRTTVVVPPVYAYRRGEVTGGGLAPLLWVRKDGTRLRNLMVLPLFYYGGSERRTTFLTPLFGFGINRPGKTHYGYVGPVFWRHGRRHRAQVIFPVFWHFHDRLRKRRFVAVAPLYFGHRSPHRKFDVGFPLVWLDRTRRGRTLLVLPLFYDRLIRGRSRTTAFVPLFYRKYDARSKHTSWLFPPALYVRTGPADRDVVLFPLFWHFSRRGPRARDARHATVGFPIYWDFKRPGYRATVVFPLFWRFAYRDRVHYFVVNTYYRHDSRNNTYRFLFLPLLEVSRLRPGDIKVGVLGGLFGYQRIGRNRSFKLFFIRIRLKPLPGQPQPGGRPQAAPRSGHGSTFYPI